MTANQTEQRKAAKTSARNEAQQGQTQLISASNAQHFRGANVARVAYSAVFLALLIYLRVELIIPWALAHCAFSLIWIAAQELGWLEDSRADWRVNFLPAAMDVGYITLLCYATGNIRSFMIVGYFLTIALSSMSERSALGLFDSLFAAFCFSLMGFLVYLGAIPNIDIVMPPAPINGLGLTVASLGMLVTFVAVNRIVAGLFSSLSAEIRVRRNAERRLLRDLDMARKVQESILPGERQMPLTQQIRCGSSYLALESVGGDLYDVFELRENCFGFVIADMSGHGVPSALITTMAKTLFMSSSMEETSAGAVLDSVNRKLCSIIADTPHYLTAFFLIIDLNAGTYEFSSAAHQPTLLLNRRSGNWRELVTADTFFLGVDPDFTFQNSSGELFDGDRFVLFTDGITEAHNEQREMFGFERLTEVVRRYRGHEPSAFVMELVAAVALFQGAALPEDDQAVFCIDFARGPNRGKS